MTCIRSISGNPSDNSFVDPGLSWADIPWFKSITKMPIVLKGVQTWEDAVMAAEAGLAGVVLSNHGQASFDLRYLISTNRRVGVTGGRQLDFAPSGIEILPEVMDALKKRGLNRPDFEV
jgi:L-lactate dehydrogenase (cytochrome)